MGEAVVTINGRECSEGQAMALRVAVAAMLDQMAEPGALGHDDMGRAIAQSYAARGREILAMMHDRKEPTR